jgi:hypothetical protein
MSHHLHPELALSLAHQRSAEIRSSMEDSRRSSYPRFWRRRPRR